MASDLKIELFGYNILQNICYLGVDPSTSYLEIYGNDCSKVEDYKEVFEDVFIAPFLSRHPLFHKIYKEELVKVNFEKFQSLFECYEYVVYTCDRDDLFGNLSVFEKMLATLTFVGEMSLYIYHRTASDIDVVKYGHIFWAMYFDKFTQEFYQKGGWKQLKKETKFYDFFLTFYCTFGPLQAEEVPEYLKNLKEASINYSFFKGVVNHQEHEYKNSLDIPVPISRQWIEFQIKQFESRINVSLQYSSLDSYGIELLLRDLKLFLVPSEVNSDDIESSKKKLDKFTVSTGTPHSETNCTSKEMNSNDDAKIQQLLLKQEKGIGDTVHKTFSTISDGLGSRCLTSTIDKSTFNIDKNSSNDGLLSKQESTENSPIFSTDEELPKRESDKDSTKNSQIEEKISTAVNLKSRPETSSKHETKFWDLDRSRKNILYRDKNEGNAINNFSERNGEKPQDEVACFPEVLSTNEMEETECHRKSSTIIHGDSRNLAFANGSGNNDNEMENTEEKLEMSCFSASDGKNEIIHLIGNLPTNQINVSDCLGNTTSENPWNLKDLYSYADNEKAIKIRKTRTDLRNEQEDPEVKNFLKMLLVLGDKEGTEFVLSTLHGSKNPQTAQENSNKQKKRSKKKKAKK